MMAGTTGEAPITVFRRTTREAAGSEGNVPVWTDGQGRTVLSRRAVSRGTLYQLHTRLNPVWSEIADSPGLPAQLLAFLQPDFTDQIIPGPTMPQALGRHDQRALDPTQYPLVPAEGTANTAVSAAPGAFRLTDLRPWLVLLAGVLFLLERLLAGRRAHRSTTSPSLL